MKLGTLIGKHRIVKEAVRNPATSSYVARSIEGDDARLLKVERQPLSPLSKTVLRAMAALLDAPAMPSSLVMAEAMALARAADPGVPRLFESGTFEGRDYLVCSLYPKAQRLDLLVSSLSRSRRLMIARQLWSSIRHLHARGIVHRDIKLSNVLVTGRTENDTRCYLIDLELSVTDGQGVWGIVGTRTYRAPDHGSGWGPPSRDWRPDVYSFGILLAALLRGRVSMPLELDQIAVSTTSLKDVLPAALSADPAHQERAAGALWRALDEECRAQDLDASSEIDSEVPAPGDDPTYAWPQQVIDALSIGDVGTALSHCREMALRRDEHARFGLVAVLQHLTVEMEREPSTAVDHLAHASLLVAVHVSGNGRVDARWVELAYELSRSADRAQYELRSHEPDPETHWRESRAALVQGDWRAAVAAARSGLLVDDSSANTWLDLAAALHMGGAWRLCEQAASRAIIRAPESVSGWMMLLHAREMAGLDADPELLEEAVDRHGHAPEVQAAVKRSLIRARDLLESGGAASAAGFSDAAAWTALARRCNRSELWDAATSAAVVALHLDPTSSEARLLACDAAASLGNYQEVFRLTDEAEATVPQLTVALRAAAAGGDAAREAAYAAALLTVDRDHRDAIATLLEYAVLANRLDDACAFGEALLRLEPTPYHQLLYAWALYGAGHPCDAERLLEVHLMRPSVGDALGKLREHLGIDDRIDPAGPSQCLVALLDEALRCGRWRMVPIWAVRVQKILVATAVESPLHRIAAILIGQNRPAEALAALHLQEVESPGSVVPDLVESLVGVELEARAQGRD